MKKSAIEPSHLKIKSAEIWNLVDFSKMTDD